MQERLGLEAQPLVRVEAGMTGKLGIAAAFELSWQELARPISATVEFFAFPVCSGSHSLVIGGISNRVNR